MPELIRVSDTNIEIWSISKVVGPGKGDTADIALVQNMLKIFLTTDSVVDSLPPADRAEIDRIFTATSRSGKKFADGIYGGNTRSALGILERKIKSPVKDGVVRPIFDTDSMGRTSGFKGTKMRDLNDFWDERLLPQYSGSKKESGRGELSPGLFSLIYPKG